jgi:tetratricopeptide (TPR) repeat protein
MNARNGWTIALVIVAGVAGWLAIDQHRAALGAQAELEAIRREDAALRAQALSLRERRANAERRTREAERDSGELLQVVEALRKGQENAAVATGEPTAGISATPGASRTRVTAVAPNLSPADNERLAQERAYQQELAKSRAAEAKARAQLDQDLRGLAPAEQFARLLDAAAAAAARADFQAAIRAYNRAMAIKPLDLPVPDMAAQLKDQLALQSTPVDVPFISDGVTYVSVANVRSPSRFTTFAVTLPPGDYEVIGRRPGYRDVRLLLQVRGGVPIAPVSVVCSEPVPPNP